MRGKRTFIISPVLLSTAEVIYFSGDWTNKNTSGSNQSVGRIVNQNQFLVVGTK